MYEFQIERIAECLKNICICKYNIVVSKFIKIFNIKLFVHTIIQKFDLNGKLIYKIIKKNYFDYSYRYKLYLYYGFCLNNYKCISIIQMNFCVTMVTAKQNTCILNHTYTCRMVKVPFINTGKMSHSTLITDNSKCKKLEMFKDVGFYTSNFYVTQKKDAEKHIENRTSNGYYLILKRIMLRKSCTCKYKYIDTTKLKTPDIKTNEHAMIKKQ
ncbi:hypothetical protein KUTeg_011166 [Tegillarca granosa]|uniref:Uncharacterized protein n=1 Tax=Tegillarca granosa TaxID=220873 RepID=A0ABQ9F3Y9_TEGGR|nr:hypothetical protein KUTeg_011166 [Tegillarca granosa]